MGRIIFNYLEENGIIESIKGDYGKTSLKVSDNDVVISGNRLELIMLADYILDVALAEFDGWHMHLDEISFFDEASKELIVELNLGIGNHPNQGDKPRNQADGSLGASRKASKYRHSQT